MNKVYILSALFERIAEVHPAILHDAATNPKFYKWSFDESNNEERSELGFPRMGLSAGTHTSLNGSYTMRDMGMQDNMMVNMVIIDKCELGDWEAEEEIYNRLKQVVDDIINWIYFASYGSDKCNWPAIEYIDLSATSYNRIGPVSQSNAFGWSVVFKCRFLENANDLSNPLITAMPFTP